MKPVEQPQGMITSGPFLTPRHLRMKSVPAEPATNWARPSWAGGICWEGAPAVEGLPQDPRGHTHTHTPPTTMMIKTLWSPLPESAPSSQLIAQHITPTSTDDPVIFTSVPTLLVESNGSFLRALITSAKFFLSRKVTHPHVLRLRMWDSFCLPQQCALI